MLQTNSNIQGKTVYSDFEKALGFYNKVIQIFGQDYEKLQLTIPQKYKDKDDFVSQFNELDDLERLIWCDHQLKQAYSSYNKREGADTAKNNILWTLMICKEFKITLNKEYQIMKMIRELWMDSKAITKAPVKDKLEQIFDALGEEKTQPKKDIRKLHQLRAVRLRKNKVSDAVDPIIA